MDLHLHFKRLIHAFAVITIAIWWPNIGVSAVSCPAVINPTVQKQIEKNNFVINRSLDDYAQNLMQIPTAFYMLLSAIPKGAIVVDFGAGQAKALKQLVEYYPQVALGVAISHTKPEDFEHPTQFGERFDYIDGGYVEDLMASGKLDHLKGRVKFATDFFGAFSYTHDIPRVIQTYIDLLEVHGRVFVHFSEKKNIVKKGTQELSLIDWLSTIPGIIVRRQSDRYAGHGSFFIQKVNDRVVVPQNLKIKKIEAASGVPARFYEMN